VANTHSDTLRTITSAVHGETTRITEDQIQHLDKELHALDDIVSRIQEQNNNAHDTRATSFANLASGVQSSYKDIEARLSGVVDRANDFKQDIEPTLEALQEQWLDDEFRKPVIGELSKLREEVEAEEMEDYTRTGQTPMRGKVYPYSTTIPRTDDRVKLLRRMQRGQNSIIEMDDELLLSLDGGEHSHPRSPNSVTVHGLREIDVNSLNSNMGAPEAIDLFNKSTASMAGAPLHDLPPLKRINTASSAERKMTATDKAKRSRVRSTVAGKETLAERENLTMPDLSASVGAGVMHPGIGRRLRSREKN